MLVFRVMFLAVLNVVWFVAFGYYLTLYLPWVALALVAIMVLIWKSGYHPVRRGGRTRWVANRN